MPKRRVLSDEAYGSEMEAGATVRERSSGVSTPHGGDHAALLNLQRTAGNRAVTSVIQRELDNKVLGKVDVKSLVASFTAAQAALGPLNRKQTKLPAKQPLPEPGRLAMGDTGGLESLMQDKLQYQKMVALAGRVEKRKGHKGHNDWAITGRQDPKEHPKGVNTWGPAEEEAEPEIQDEWSTAAAAKHQSASEAAGTVTPFLKDLAGSEKFAVKDERSKRERKMLELVGLENQLKTVDSLARKMRGQQSSDDIRDALRYTAQFPTEGFTSNTLKLFAELEAQGCEKIIVKNTFLPGPKGEAQIYRGINASWFHRATETVFELQVHTPESFHAKDAMNHPLYEASRVLKPKEHAEDMADKGLLDEQMRSWSGNQKRVPTPEGVESIQNEDNKSKYDKYLKRAAT